MFGNTGGRSYRSGSFKGQDLASDVHLKMTDILEAQKQTLSVNGKNIRLTIPAGVEDGQTIKISGVGGEGVNGGPKGDLYITFKIQNDTTLKREGSNLLKTIELDIYTAVLGGEIMVDTLSSKVKLKVVPGTQNNTKVKLKGKGLPVYKKENEFGDLVITYTVKIPTNLTDKQIELFKELANS
jgi:curved DNA-binding protein